MIYWKISTSTMREIIGFTGGSKERKSFINFIKYNELNELIIYH